MKTLLHSFCILVIAIQIADAQFPTLNLLTLLTLTAIIFINNSTSCAQSPQKLWHSFYNGILDGKDEAKNILTDSKRSLFLQIAESGLFRNKKNAAAEIKILNNGKKGPRLKAAVLKKFYAYVV